MNQLCLIINDNSKQVQEKKKIDFVDKIKFKALPGALFSSTHEMSMVCAIDEESFFTFTKYTWIGNLEALCYVSHDDTEVYDVTNINKLG